ncbi:alpha-mannosidase [Sutcliffiella halmapala]|uniref:alpha-mannosidase n=1 Tax=Sutcliffiella halmapala TaxID=79882 RepID=UPI0009949831|nr:alpha-mannosidase [Sutcliffiella halmapala]
MKIDKTAHIISHSHWDREWYMSLEEHRYYLVKLFDDLLEKLEEDPHFHSFHLDGQTIMVDDYLQVRPEKEEKVKQYIREGRLIVGPWYILQDAFLTSSEANVRNLLYGMKDTKKLGQDGVIGYFPDTFGVYGQAPQLLKQANMDVAAFGRGVTPTGFNNQVHHSDDYSSPYSEMIWESPDGSSVLGILFANWYSNGNEIPEDKDEAKQFWEKKLADAEKFASTSQLLFMNGCDHQPLQKNIVAAIETAKEVFPNIEFKHSSFQEYIEELKAELPAELQTIRGELRNQKTDGWSTLVNTASARIYLKQANDRCQSLLERVMEPIGLLGKDRNFHQDFLEYYWKLLMENHPHDSICGCSVDEVHREMETRFEKVEKGARKFIEEQAREIAQTIPTKHEQSDAVPLAIFHTSGEAATQVIKKKVAVKKIYFSEMDFNVIPNMLKNENLPHFYIERHDKIKLYAHVKDLGVAFGYDLPNDGFRRPYYAREVEVTFSLQSAIHVGYEICYLVPTNEPASIEQPALIWNETNAKLENEKMTVSIHENGSYTIVDKHTGKVYDSLGIYEDVGDIGNEYMFKETGDGKRETTEHISSSLKPIENNGYRASVEISSSFLVPKSADEQLKEERENLVWHPKRTAGRTEEKVPLTIKTVLTLEKEAKGLQVEVTIENTAKDHRLRALFPVGEGNTQHYADSIFEIAQRSNKPEQQWKNPTFDHHMQRFVSLDDTEYGLTIATKGLHEYEIVDNGTIAITLLRAVEELGDWGVFETPEAQCLGTSKVQFLVIPHKGNVLDSKAYLTAYRYPLEPTVIQVEQHIGKEEQTTNLFSWTGEGLVLTTSKLTLEEKGIALRWFNPTKSTIKLEVETNDQQAIYFSTILEEKREKLGKSSAELIVKPNEIVTLLIKEQN